MGLSLCVYITTRLKMVVHVYVCYGPQTELKFTFIF